MRVATAWKGRSKSCERPAAGGCGVCSGTTDVKTADEPLIGRKVSVSVGEPWDFESSAGPNRLEGEVFSVDTSPGSQSVSVRVNPFETETGEKVTVLTASARYTEDVESFVRLLADGESVSSNLDYSDQVSRERMPEGSHPFLIGSVRLTDQP